MLEMRDLPLSYWLLIAVWFPVLPMTVWVWTRRQLGPTLRIAALQFWVLAGYVLWPSFRSTLGW